MHPNGNAASYFIDRHLDSDSGDALAFVDPWRRLTYTALCAATARFAAALRQAGVAREQRIALVSVATRSTFPWRSGARCAPAWSRFR